MFAKDRKLNLSKQTEQERYKKHIKKAITNQSHSNYADRLIHDHSH